MFVILSLLFSLAAFAAPCDDAGQIYRVCADQSQVYTSAEEVAQGKKQNLIVVFGAQWCPWCHSLHRLFQDKAFEARWQKKYQLVEVGLYKDREKSPTGEAVLQKLLGYAKEKEAPKGVPLMVVVDPLKRKAVFINTEPLEKNTADAKGHDPDKVFGAIEKASKQLRK